jgi:hypothetical protein
MALLPAIALGLFCLLTAGPSCAAPQSPAETQSEQSLPPQPNGDRLVRLLKKIADEGLLLEPERMARTLDIPMTFETKPSDFQNGCDSGDTTWAYKTFLVIEAKVGDSWFKAGSEGVPDMKVPSFAINQGYVVGAPEISFSLYRTVRCKTPTYTKIEASLGFRNLSSFSCLQPDRLLRLIGAKYRMATDGVSLSSYSPPATEGYGTDLEFTFQVGAPCAVGASVRLGSRTGFREQRAFVKWRTCIDKAKADYCAAHPSLKSEDSGKLHDFENASCEEQAIYTEREPPSGGPPAFWPTFKPISDNPCDE